MSGSSVPVFPGPARQIFGVLTEGSTIVNTDGVNSVWVSSRFAVAPGNGIEIPPFGSATWSNKAEQVYACVDTGVLVPVILVVSDDVSVITDPLGVAVATATQLAATGIPNVLTQTLIGQIQQGVDTWPKIYDVSQYASVLLIGYNGPIQYGFIPLGTLFAGPSIEADVIAPPTAVFISSEPGVEIRVIGSKLKIGGAGWTVQSATASVSIIGSNRPALQQTRRLDSSSNSVSQVVVGPQTLTAGTAYALGGDLNSGVVFAHFSVTGTVVKGRFDIVTADGVNIVYTDTGEMHASASGNQEIYKQIILPRTGFTWRFVCTVGVAATGQAAVRTVGS